MTVTLNYGDCRNNVTHKIPSLTKTTSAGEPPGSCLMVLSMAAFSGEDSVIKMISSSLPIGQILFLLGIGGAIAFGLSASILKRNLWTSDILSWSKCICG